MSGRNDPSLKIVAQPSDVTWTQPPQMKARSDCFAFICHAPPLLDSPHRQYDKSRHSVETASSLSIEPSSLWSRCSSQRSPRLSSSPSLEYGPKPRWPTVNLAMTGCVSGLVLRNTSQGDVTARCSDGFPGGPIEPQFPRPGSLHCWFHAGCIVSWSWRVDSSWTSPSSLLRIVVCCQRCTTIRHSTLVNTTFPQRRMIPVTWTATVTPSCTSTRSRLPKMMVC